MNQALRQRLENVQQCLSTAAEQAGRSHHNVTLVAVSKRHPAQAVRDMAALGQRDFGENYIDEAVAKIAEADPQHALTWHFIGPLQSNKTRLAAEHFDWVQTIDRFKIARRLSEQRPADKPPLNVLIQVNVSGEDSKSGCALAEVDELVDQILSLDNVRLRGLMSIPAALDDHEEQRKQLRPLATLFARLQVKHPSIDTLSMGMTDDLEAAVVEGSTMLRIGTALFGPRPD